MSEWVVGGGWGWVGFFGIFFWFEGGGLRTFCWVAQNVDLRGALFGRANPGQKKRPKAASFGLDTPNGHKCRTGWLDQSNWPGMSLPHPRANQNPFLTQT